MSPLLKIPLYTAPNPPEPNKLVKLFVAILSCREVNLIGFSLSILLRNLSMVVNVINRESGLTLLPTNHFRHATTIETNVIKMAAEC